MDLENGSIEEIIQGYTHNATQGTYTCLECGRQFYEGEIYPIQERFFDALHALHYHRQAEHPDYSLNLIEKESKYNTLTDNQKQLMMCFAQGMSDNEIAKKLNLSASTVRHQKFMFREKRKQAKFFLALSEPLMNPERKKNALMPIHDTVTMMDDRFIITEEEKEHILKTAFISLNPLKLKLFSPKEKKKIVILTRIMEEFDASKHYSEKEVNAVLKAIYDDFVTLRRYLIQYGYMQRSDDGSDYWVKQS